MKVLLRTSLFYKGEFHEAGSVIDVSEEEKKLYVKKHIAVSVAEDSKKEPTQSNSTDSAQKKKGK